MGYLPLFVFAATVFAQWQPHQSHTTESLRGHDIWMWEKLWKECGFAGPR